MHNSMRGRNAAGNSNAKPAHNINMLGPALGFGTPPASRQQQHYYNNKSGKSNKSMGKALFTIVVLSVMLFSVYGWIISSMKGVDYVDEAATTPPPPATVSLRKAEKKESGDAVAPCGGGDDVDSVETPCGGDDNISPPDPPTIQRPPELEEAEESTTTKTDFIRHTVTSSINIVKSTLDEYSSESDEQLYLYITCDDDNNESSTTWKTNVEDCKNGEAALKNVLASARLKATKIHFLQLLVTTELEWKQNFFHTDADWKIKHLPALVNFKGYRVPSTYLGSSLLSNEKLVTYMLTRRSDKEVIPSVSSVTELKQFLVKQKSKKTFMYFVSGLLPESQRPWRPYCRLSDLAVEFAFINRQKNRRQIETLVKVLVDDQYSHWKSGENEFKNDLKLHHVPTLAVANSNFIKEADQELITNDYTGTFVSISDITAYFEGAYNNNSSTTTTNTSKKQMAITLNNVRAAPGEASVKEDMEVVVYTVDVIEDSIEEVDTVIDDDSVRRLAPGEVLPTHLHSIVSSYDEAMEILKKHDDHKDYPMFVFFNCKDDKTLWHPSCAPANKTMHDVLRTLKSPVHIVEAQYATEAVWKASEFRDHYDFKVKRVPSILRWIGGPNNVIGSYLGRHTCENAELVQYLLGERSSASSLTKSISQVSNHNEMNEILDSYDGSHPFYVVFESGKITKNQRAWCPYCRYADIPVEYSFLKSAPANAQLLKVKVSDSHKGYIDRSNPFKNDYRNPIRGIPQMQRLHLDPNTNELSFIKYEPSLLDTDELESFFTSE